MRIVILSINYWPEETGIGAFTTYRAEYLASVGHDVAVCTAFPYYPEWKVAREYRGRLLQTERRNGVRILRSYAYIPRPVTSFKRLVHEASFVAGSLARAMANGRPDVLLVVSPPLGLAVSGVLLSRMWGVPFVFDVEDLQPDAAADLGMLPRWAVRMMYGVERMAYRNAALVSTITRGMRDKIVQKGVASEKVVLFEPRADDALFDIAAGEGLAFRRKYGLERKFLVTHSGNIGVKQGLEVVLDAAAMTRDDDSLIYLLVGDGAAREAVMRGAAQRGLDYVKFLPVLDGQDFRGLLAASDVCLVTQRKSVSDIVFPSKMVTYLAAGCPVIASVSAASEAAQVVRDSGAGLLVEPEDAVALRNAIRALRSCDLREHRRSARSYAGFRWSSARVLKFLERSLVAVPRTVPSPLAERGTESLEP
ncbi:MAG TPA: WcaI family glycosyltransferase [Terracidiphilus sp.]|nr:WcaI family glycosyltransferase [Terracidiphilus sp.]